MALQLGALREALLNAGASPETATKAAEEVAGYETRLASMETKMAVILAVLGVNTTLVVSILFLLLRAR